MALIEERTRRTITLLGYEEEGSTETPPDASSLQIERVDRVAYHARMCAGYVACVMRDDTLYRW